MRIESTSLKTWYCHEREKLEGLPMFVKESQRALHEIKQEVVRYLSQQMDMAQLQSRYARNPHLRVFFESPITAVSFNNLFARMLEDEEAEVVQEAHKIQNDFSDRSLAYSYALYLFQLEKVLKIEEIMRSSAYNMDPDGVYREYQQRRSKDIAMQHDREAQSRPIQERDFSL